jgi:hypothetical protein
VFVLITYFLELKKKIIRIWYARVEVTASGAALPLFSTAWIENIRLSVADVIYVKRPINIV